jgi:cytoskeletal protein CcmA (bactofilin family)
MRSLIYHSNGITQREAVKGFRALQESAIFLFDPRSSGESRFTRNDKAPEPITLAKPPLRETGDMQMTDFGDTRRLQPTPRPISPLVASPASVISKSLKITGQLETTEDIRIEGQVDGDVRGASVSVGSSARIKGTVYGEDVEVSGTVDGRIEASKVVLTQTAHVSGDIIYLHIQIESGAYFDGHCRPEFGKPGNKPVVLAPESVTPPGDQPSPARDGDGAVEDLEA